MSTHSHSIWGYEADNGPHTWARLCANAAGANQSPINIESRRAQFDQTLVDRPLTLNVSSCKSATLMNTGHGFQVKLHCEAELSQGPLKDVYRFVQFHMHWGRDCSWGSEHTVDGVPGGGELHLVFWNAGKYQTFDEAIHHPDGLAVLGVLLHEGAENAELVPLFQHFSAIQHADQRVEQLSAIHIEKLLPANKLDYYTYQGSLTTPPCNECVTWIVFKDTMTLSAEQLASCRNLCCTGVTEAEQILLEETYRTVCPLGKRVLRKSFH